MSFSILVREGENLETPAVNRLFSLSLPPLAHSRPRKGKKKTLSLYASILRSRSPPSNCRHRQLESAAASSPLTFTPTGSPPPLSRRCSSSSRRQIRCCAVRVARDFEFIVKGGSR
ncbi:unnamed protein product [Citrullus colocynthis]|uniref:Uncharacterized protein n=1 Tax=Citrullus colocynthis TaxID=252529 RepID=A0ABP0ZC87_9ROSI